MRQSLKKSFRKLGIKESSTSPNQASEPTTQSSSLPESSLTDRPLSLTAQLWDDAYNALKRDHPKLITEYEALLVKEINADAGASIANNGSKRRTQMDDIVKKGLAKAELQADKKKTVAQVTQTLILIKDAVATALKTSSEASLAWAAVTGSLLLLNNVMDQDQKQLDGLREVSAILVKTDTMAPYRFRDVGLAFQDILRTSLTKLYEKLLGFLIRASCQCNRNRLSAISRDIIKFDDWEKQLKEIQDAERDVLDLDKDIKAQSTAQYQKAHLSSIRDEKDNACLAKIKLSDPRHDKKRIESSKGGLLRDAYAWILTSQEFAQWKKDGGLLWIKGDPGKGKTMLLCGIIDELSTDMAYFFCQATNNAINTGVAVLRGLIYMMADQNTALIPIIRKRLDKSNNIFDANSWFFLSEILEEMLNPNYSLIVDALDECIEGRQELIRFIRKNRDKARWVISSRNWLDIEDELESVPRISLEIDSASVTQAVEYYIRFKVDQLAVDKKYDRETKEFVRKFLKDRANGTFLWIALVCINLNQVRNWDIKPTLLRFPADLDKLYERMWMTMKERDLTGLLQRILTVSALVLRPVSFRELEAILEMPEEAIATLDQVVQECGSFLTVRQGFIEFIHQSAKDYIDKQIRGSSESLHREIFTCSMHAMSSTLKRDIYGLQVPAIAISEVPKLEPASDPLDSIRYSCINWCHHLAQSGFIDLEEIVLRQFFLHNYLPWLEATSLLESTVTAISTMYDLQALLKINPKNGKRSENSVTQNRFSLSSLVFDAARFVQYFRGIFEEFPLQMYYAGLLFSPETSVIRAAFSSESPRSITLVKSAQPDWPSIVTSVNLGPDMEQQYVSSICFSHDAERVALGYQSGLLQVWNIRYMALVQNAKRSSKENWGSPEDMTFLHGDKEILCHDNIGAVLVWNLASNEVSVLNIAKCIAISPPGLIATQDKSTLIQLYEIQGSKLQKQGCLDLTIFTSSKAGPPYFWRERTIVFSAEAQSIAARTEEKTIEIWDIKSRSLRCRISIIGYQLHAMALSENYLCICEDSQDPLENGMYIVRLYDVRCAQLLWKLPSKEYPLSDLLTVTILQDRFVVFSDYISFVLAVGSGDCVWTSPNSDHWWLLPDTCHIMSIEQGSRGQPALVIRDFQQEAATDNVKFSVDAIYPSGFRLRSLTRDGCRIAESESVPGGYHIITELKLSDVNHQTSLPKQTIESPSNWSIEDYSEDQGFVIEKFDNELQPKTKHISIRISKILPSKLETVLVLDGVLEYNGRPIYSFAPDESALAVVVKDAGLVIWDMMTLTETFSLNFSALNWLIQWSEDSRRVLVFQQEGFIVIDSLANQVILTDNRAVSMGFSEDGTSLMAWYPDGFLSSSSSEVSADEHVTYIGTLGELSPSFSNDLDESEEELVNEFSIVPDSQIPNELESAVNRSFGIKDVPTMPCTQDTNNLVDTESEQNLMANAVLKPRYTEGKDVNTENEGEQEHEVDKDQESERLRRRLSYVEGGDWIEWNLAEGHGQLLSEFRPSFDKYKSCFNKRYIVVAAISQDSNSELGFTIWIWKRDEARLLQQLALPWHIYRSMTLENHILRLNCGVVSMEEDSIRLGPANECFVDGGWLWQNNQKIAHVPRDYRQTPRYSNRTLAMSRDDGGTIVLRFVAETSALGDT